MTEYIVLLPAIVVIVMAIMTKRTAEPLLLGVIVSYIIKDGVHFFASLNSAFFSVLTDYDSVWLIVTCGVFGSLIALLNASGGTIAIARGLGRICKTQKQTLIASWVIGILIFIDDYMNIMTISSCMKRLSDEQGLPREALAYSIDSTGAPTCVLVPFSTWAIFYAGIFLDCKEVTALGFLGVSQLYVKIIPFLFYAIFALLLVPLFALGAIPALGDMKRAYAESRKKAVLIFGEEEQKGTFSKANMIDFLIPIILLIVVTVFCNDIFIAVIAAILSCLFLYIPRKIMGLKKLFDCIINGFAEMIPCLWIIVTALMMRQAQIDINLPEFIVNNTLPYVVRSIFPAAVFVIVSGMAFITGSNWGIPAVCAPIVIPLAAAANVNLFVVMAAIVSGGTFSSHACFYSDATVLTSSCCGMDNMRHASSQLPYALIAFALSTVAYLICGIVMC